MRTPVSARIPEPDERCAANFAVRELAGIFATSMLSPGQADVIPVELAYEDGRTDIVMMVTGTGPDGQGFTSLAGLLFGNEESTSADALEWAGSLRPLIQEAIDAYDVDPEPATEAEVVAVAEAEAELDQAAEATRVVEEGR